jgi:hypothetical protein
VGGNIEELEELEELEEVEDIEKPKDREKHACNSITRTNYKTLLQI